MRVPRHAGQTRNRLICNGLLGTLSAAGDDEEIAVGVGFEAEDVDGISG